MPRDRIAITINSLLELFSMHPHRFASIGTYSEGMRQRILLIAALMDNPDIFIFDEPLSGLDVTSALIFKNLVQELGQTGQTGLLLLACAGSCRESLHGRADPAQRHGSCAGFGNEPSPDS